MPVNQRILKAVSRDRSQVKYAPKRNVSFGNLYGDGSKIPGWPLLRPPSRPAKRPKRRGFYPGQRYDVALRKNRFR